MAWISGALGLAGALFSSDSASSASDSQAQASAASVAEQRRQYDQTREDQQPWMQAGGRALGSLESGIDQPLDRASVMMDPGYQFGLTQGQQAIDRSTAAAGGRISGAALKAAAEYGNDYASTKYDAAYNRGNQARSDRLNRLAALAGVGQTSAQQVGTLGALTGRGISDTLSAQGNAAGAGQLAQGGIWGGAANQLAALYGRNRGGGGGGSVNDGGYASGQGSAYGGSTDNGMFTPFRAGM